MALAGFVVIMSYPLYWSFSLLIRLERQANREEGEIDLEFQACWYTTEEKRRAGK